MCTADVDRLLLRFRMALFRAAEGTAEWDDVRCLTQVGLDGDFGGPLASHG